MSEAKHSETPWECGRATEEPDTVLIGADGILFCRVVGIPGNPAEQIATRIVRSVNAHDDLVAALKQVEHSYCCESIYCGFERRIRLEPDKCDCHMRVVSAALAKAIGQPTPVEGT